MVRILWRGVTHYRWCLYLQFLLCLLFSFTWTTTYILLRVDSTYSSSTLRIDILVSSVWQHPIVQTNISRTTDKKRDTTTHHNNPLNSSIHALCLLLGHYSRTKQQAIIFKRKMHFGGSMFLSLGTSWFQHCIVLGIHEGNAVVAKSIFLCQSRLLHTSEFNFTKFSPSRPCSHKMSIQSLYGELAI